MVKYKLTIHFLFLAVHLMLMPSLWPLEPCQCSYKLVEVDCVH